MQQNGPKLSLLPQIKYQESSIILKKLITTHQSLAELKGFSSSMPNQEILLSTLALQEAKESSEIENIITTHDEIYRSEPGLFVTQAVKEVHAYAKALRTGFDRVKKSGLLTLNDILEIQSTIEDNQAGLRKLPGTVLKNDRTEEIVYTPPQNASEILSLMSNLEQFTNDDSLADWDPLVKMAVIHHQFESIHPFYDGNGRTGRVINILYLVKQGLLDSPILYLSRYINQNKDEYYRLLQTVRMQERWEEWILYILDGVEKISRETIKLIVNIKLLMQSQKQLLRNELPKLYSQDLLNHLFSHPYTKIDHFVSELSIHRNTARKYLDAISRIGLLSKKKIGKESYYLNESLFDLLHGAGSRKNGT